MILNLSRYDPRRIRRASALLTGALVALALLVLAQVAAVVALGRSRAGAGRPAAELVRELDRREARLEELRGRLAGEDPRRLRARITFLNGVLAASVVSWTGLLAELEGAIPARVSLAEIQPDLDTGKVRLHGVAASPDRVAAFARRLEERPAFEEVVVVQQAARPDRERGERAGVEFRVSLVYRSDRSGR